MFVCILFLDLWFVPVIFEDTMKYKLTFWQRLQLIPIFYFWLISENRKTWHEVKKGMEYHEHNFATPIWEQGFRFWQCDHEGCTCCESDSAHLRRDLII